MIYPNKSFFLDLYETCLLAGDSSYNLLGERTCAALGLRAVSLWEKHPRVKNAESRISFYQTDEEPSIVAKDQELARLLLTEEQNILGEYAGLFYWGRVLAGRHNKTALLFWSQEEYSEVDRVYLEKSSARLEVLIDLIAQRALPEFKRVSKELATAQFIQDRLMPSVAALGGEKHISYRNLPVHELGGDYLDILPYKGGKVGLTVADAMGKGVPGAFIILMARTIFRFIASEKLAPHRVLSTLNNQFIREISDVDTFVTQFYGIYDAREKTLSYANAGHNPPIILRSKQPEATILSGNGIALGGKADAVYHSYSTQLETGDIVVIFSDGLADARNEQGRQFGLPGIMEAVGNFREYTAEGICDGLIAAVMKHCHVQKDDISFLVLKVE